MKKILWNTLTVVALFVTLPAFAEWGRGHGGQGRPGHGNPDWGRGRGHGGGGGGGWGCARAEQEFNQALAAFNQAQAMMLNNAQVCPGGWQSNPGCMVIVANNYNQAKVNLENADERYRRACGRHR